MAGRRPSIDALLEQSDQRQKAVERLPTDPDKHYMNAVKKVKLRSKTTPSDMFTDDITAETYGARLFDKLLTGLESQNLSTLHLALRHYEWLVPNRDASPDILAVFDQISVAVPTVTNADLTRIIAMEESTITSPFGIEGHHYFYVRELVLSGSELKDLIGYMRTSDDGFEESSEWRDMLELYGPQGPNGFDTWTLRYVGTVEGPRRPIDRFIEDLELQQSNILGETYQAIETIHPHVMRDAKVYVLPKATQSPDNGMRAQDTERLLIEFFHHPSLLNRQRGGYHSSYLPTQDEVERFQALETDAWYVFETGAHEIPETMDNELSMHFEAIQDYANSFPAESGTAIHAFTDEVRKTALEEARPYQFHGTTILTFLGKDITYTDFKRAKSFWDGGSQAMAVTKGILQRTVDSEAESHNRSYLRDIRSRSSLWCFANLWPWLWHKNNEQAMFFLSEYVNIVRPLIIVSYSRPVNSVTRADFMHNKGVSMSGMSPFTQIVGRPSIQFYHHAELSGQPRDDCAFINIPHLDPGRDKYGKQDVRMRRLLEISMQQTFLIVDIALKTVSRYALDDSDLPSRSDLCKEILDELEALQNPEQVQFSSALADARTQCKHYFSTCVKSSTDDVRPFLDADGRLKLFELGRAEGEPESGQRSQQLNRLWELNVPDLHIHIAHTHTNKNRWMETFLSLQKGQYLYLAALAHCEPDAYFQNVFEKFAPDGSDKLWFQDQRKRGQAVINAGLWITRKVQEDEKNKPRLRVHFPSEFLSASEIQDSLVGIVQSSGMVRIRWQKDKNTRVVIPISSKLAIPQKPQETRVLHFTIHGLDILDASGHAFRTVAKDGHPISATIPRVQFGDKPDLDLLWRAVLKAQNIDEPEEEDQDEEKFDWGTKGVAALSSKARSMNPLQNRPMPDPADANYILYKFLDEPDFLNGGVFETLAPFDRSGAPEHVKRFVEFLRQPQWARHPYRDWWLSNFDREKPEMAILAKNIPVYRSCTRHNKQVYSETRKGTFNQKSQGRLQVQNTTFTIGPPGSAFDDPFDAAHGQSTIGRPATGKNAKGKGKSTAMDSDEEDEDDANTQSKPSAKGMSKRRATTGGNLGGRDDDDEDEDEDEFEMAPKASSKRRKLA